MCKKHPELRAYPALPSTQSTISLQVTKKNTSSMTTFIHLALHYFVFDFFSLTNRHYLFNTDVSYKIQLKTAIECECECEVMIRGAILDSFLYYVILFFIMVYTNQNDNSIHSITYVHIGRYTLNIRYT